MGYINAEEILPIELIEEIWQYVDGENIYIPRKTDNRQQWGAGTRIKEELNTRNQQIFEDYLSGRKISELATLYYLSEKSIQRIIRKMRDLKVEKKYRTNDALRHSFNELAKKTFGLDFEDWYQNGYWRDNYSPYSIVIDGEVVANVSVNITDMVWNGSVKHFIQLGTVMTEEKYRNQGLIRTIMAEIEKDYSERIDGMYLFANDSVLGFYPKFGFEKAVEYEYSKQVTISGEGSMKPLLMNNKEAWAKFVDVINKSVPFGSFEMTGNSDLIMFYITKFMQECVYYDEGLDVHVIAEVEEGELLIHNVFSEQKVDLDDVISAFGKSISKVILGFTPEDKSGYTVSLVQNDDTTLFFKGISVEEFEADKLMFPTLSHA